MDNGIYGCTLHSTGEFTDKSLMPPAENLMMIPVEYTYHGHNLVSSSTDHFQQEYPFQFSDDIAANGLLFQCSAASEAASIAPDNDDDEEGYSLIKAKIASHPSYQKLLDAYIDCQKVGAPPEIASLLDEIRGENNFCDRNAFTQCLGSDPELDDFMETFCDILMKYKLDLSRPFDEATTFLSKIETQLGNLCKGDSAIPPDEEGSGGETELVGDNVEMRLIEDRELKDRLLEKYGSHHITTLKLEFSKKKKKGKLPKQARQILLQWWNVHYRWPYPTEADKTTLAELSGLDQKQINNWFINQRKRHWKPSENMQLAMHNPSGYFFPSD